MKPLTIEAMDRLVYLAAPDLRKDGNEVICTVTRVNESRTGFSSQIRRICTGGETECAKSAPDRSMTACINSPSGSLVAENSELAKYAPKGGQIACLCAESGVHQIWLWEEGKLRQLTHLRHGVSDFCWLPDGQGLVWEAPLWPEDRDRAFEEMTPEERKVWKERKAKEPIVVEELMYKLDETGLFDGSVHQIGVTRLDGASRLLTRACYEHRKPVPSPEGRTIVYYAYPDGGIHRLRAQIFALELEEEPIEGKQRAETPWPVERRVTNEDYLIDSIPLLFDPAAEEGRLVTALTYIKKETGFVQLPQLFDVESGQAKPLFETECPSEEINNMVVGRNAYGRETPPYAFSEDGGRFYYTSLWKGSQRLYCYDRASQVHSCLTQGEISIQAISLVKAGRVAYLKGTLSRPAELYVCELPEEQLPTGETCMLPLRQERQLTDENAWLSEYALPPAVSLDVPSAEGKSTVHGWYIKPAGLREGEKVPAVLDIHGGPDCGYSANFWFEFAYLASRGLAVVYCDPRGSAGYGASYRAGDCAYGEEAQSDLLTFLDAVGGLGFIDMERCGVTGGSYGGYMTNRLISTTDRFAVAVTQRNLCNLSTSYGTGDMGFVTGKKDFTTMLRMFKERVSSRTTTLRWVDRIRTPLLILHGTADYRCSFEQGEQLFIAMKERNPQVPVRFVAFPGENHGLTRSGSPRAQREHLREMADWFVKYLNKEDAG